MDLPSNIRLGFGIPISKNFQIGFGRTKFNKMYDIEGKYILLRQTSDNRKPIALAAYFNTAIMTARFPSVPSNGYFSDGTPFEYRFSHRLSYNTQLIVSRNFGNTVALQLATVMIYQNLVAPNRDNHIFVIPFSGAIRTGLSSSIIFEYSYILNKQYPSNLNPASIGYEIGTPGHTFQIFISSGQDILEQEFYRNEPANYLKGNFLLGFNIKRVFRKKSS